MSNTLQSGIYYSKKLYKSLGDCFGILFLRAKPKSSASEVGETLSGLWNMYKELQLGIENDLRDVDPKHRHHGDLSVLLAYGPSLFDKIKDAKQKKPLDLFDNLMFLSPKQNGGVILSGSGLKYAEDVTTNELALDDIAVQFVSSSQLATYRAIVETWKHLKNYQDKIGKEILYLSHFYTGFERPDRRGWLGFHDGISNMKPDERLSAIVINNSTVSRDTDSWTIGGSYLAFLRINVDIDKWRKTSLKDQQIIVGRHKLTGCPLMGLDHSGNPVKDDRCPVPGTSEVIEDKNELFREHPRYGTQSYTGQNISGEVLSKSHIGRTHHINKMPPIRVDSFRIFRQGFEFLESTDSPPFFRVGLNFVSFQNSTQRIFKILTTPHWLGGTNFGGDPRSSHMADFLSVQSAGLFLVPPRSMNSSFPGSTVFL